MLRQRLGRPALWLAGLSIAALGMGVAQPAVADGDKGSISGTITLDPALTDSTLDGIVVSVASSTYEDRTFADVDGKYEIKDLPAGSYTVSFGSNSLLGGDPALINEYYDDVYSQADARVITVNGNDVKGINAQLSRTGHFTATPNPTILYKSLASGSTLGSSTGSWRGPAATTLAYAWLRDGIAIAGANGSTYVIKTADRGHKITLRVTGTADHFPSVSRTSAAVYIPKVFTAAPTPTISGTAKAGSTLTAHRGTWKPTPTFSYQWYRNGAKISGATKSTYKVTKSDKGKKITVKVTGKRAGYATTVKTSAAKAIAR